MDVAHQEETALAEVRNVTRRTGLTCSSSGASCASNLSSPLWALMLERAWQGGEKCR